MAAPNPEDRSQLYAQRADRFGAEAERHAARSRWVSNLRGLSFGAFVVAALFALFGSEKSLAASVAGLAATLFVVLLALHARILAAEDDALRWARVNRDARARCSGGWRRLPDDGARFSSATHPYADDVDLFGPGSLFQRINVAHTHFGQEALARFVGEPAALDVIRARQEAVKALADQIDLRQRLEALSLAVVEAPDAGRPARAASHAPDPEPLLRWAEGEMELHRRPLVVWAARLLPPLTLAALAAVFWFRLPIVAFTLPLALEVLIVFTTRETAARVFNAVSSTEGAFLRYGAMLELLENLELDAGLLHEMRQRVLGAHAAVEQVRPSDSMKEFRRSVGWFDLRHNGLIHPFVNLLLLWDVHCVLLLERWQKRSGRAVRSWFVALGELEALSSFAGLAFDEPRFAFAEVSDGAAVFEARDLGHPLIDSPTRVVNDVSLPGASTALLVTGSNMSGKSTLLRAMALCAVLALAGAPACATRVRLSRLAVRTSIRVSDSLESGVSHFYAELSKLKRVVDATHGETPVLFLLDEILHGTNSRERQIGARWLLSELLLRGAIGAVSTHDMDLCQLPAELMRHVSLVHFRENVRDSHMTFDYRLRTGPVTSGNALRLMQLVGLDVPLE